MLLNTTAEVRYILYCFWRTFNAQNPQFASMRWDFQWDYSGLCPWVALLRPHGLMSDILWTKPCRNVLSLKVQSWPWKQQHGKNKKEKRNPDTSSDLVVGSGAFGHILWPSLTEFWESGKINWHNLVETKIKLDVLFLYVFPLQKSIYFRCREWRVAEMLYSTCLTFTKNHETWE